MNKFAYFFLIYNKIWIFLQESHKFLNDGKESNANYLIVDVPLGFIQRIEKMFNYNSNQINELMGILINCKVNNFNIMDFYDTIITKFIKTLKEWQKVEIL